ncbi:MAG: hypothetical protein PQ964_08955 [Methanobacteriaceae archaeon]|jgi:hypothetical protein
MPAEQLEQMKAQIEALPIHLFWILLIQGLIAGITINAVVARIKTESVISAAIMHGSLNGTAGLAIIMLEGGNDLIIGITGIAGFIVLLIVNLFIFPF